MSVREASSCVPHSGDANAVGCLVDYTHDLDALAFGHNSKRSAFSTGNCSRLRFELRALCAELRHKVLKLDPIRDAQPRPLLGGVAIKRDRVSAWTNGDALQNSVLSFLRDLRGFDFGGLLQEFGRN